MRELDLAWAAGFFDGEGCISTVRVGNPRNYVYINIFVSQNDIRPLEKFLRIFPGGRIYKKKIQEHMLCYYSKKSVANIITSLWPYFSELSKEKYQRATHKLEQLTMEIRDTGVRYIYSKSVRPK